MNDDFIEEKKKKIKLKNSEQYWRYLESLKIEGKPHCLVD